MQDMYHKYFEDFKLDETCRSSGRQMTEADTRISIGVIGGSHPLHIDPEYCASRPDVGRPIVQGSMVLGFIDAGMYDALCPGGEVVVIPRGYDKIRFMKPIYIGDIINCEFQVKGVSDFNDRYGQVTLLQYITRRRCQSPLRWSIFWWKRKGDAEMGMTRYFEEFQVGERIISRSRTLEMADIRMYSACTSLCARIHSDPVYCRGIPALKRITVNVVDGFYAQSVSPDGVPTFHYGYDKTDYCAPIYPGDCIHTEFVLVDKQEKNQQFGVLTFQCRTFNQNGDVVIEHIDKLYVGKKSAFCAGQAG